MRCPISEDGTHHMEEVGYDPPWYGVVHRCGCGHTTLFPTDEMRAAGF